MINKIAAAAIAFMTGAFLLSAGCGGSSDKKQQPPTMPTEIKTEFFPGGEPVQAELGKPFGDFTTTDIYGNPVRLSDYRGKVVMLDFWATWCPPCEEEVPNMKAVYEKYHDKGFEIIGVSLDRNPEKLVNYLTKNEIKWVQIYTGDGWKTPIAVHYSVARIPAPWLIGKDGKLLSKDARAENLEPLVKDALKQETPEEASEQETPEEAPAPETSETSN